MGDSACLVHGFSYASAIPNESKLGNPMHALGESISFGRFMTESLSWEKWSTFSHRKYVEEAERYAQPGSVAQKKAFFEAHYKRIAAQKAAALLEQENAAKRESDGVGDNNNTYEEQRAVLLNSVDVKMEEAKTQDAKENDVLEVETRKEAQNDVITGNEERNSDNQLDDLENQGGLSVSEGPKMERPLVKNSVDSEDIPSETSKKRSSFSSSNSMGQKRASPRSLSALMNLAPMNDPEKEPILATRKTESSSGTPLRTPAAAPPIKSVLPTYPAAASPSENKRMKMPTDPSAPGSKRTGPKWNILSAVCSTLRTERAAKRKQKFEEKFNASEVQKMQLQKTTKEKAGKEFGKLGRAFCFKARLSPEFHKERETPKNQMKKTPAAQTESAMLGKSISNKKQGNISMPPPPPPPTYLAKNSASKSSSKKNALKPSKSLANTLPERNTHENASPNIQQ